MGIELKVLEVVEQAKAQGLNAAELRRLIRKQEADLTLRDEMASLETVFNNPTHTPNWEEVKAFIRAPVQGEAQLGKALADIADAVRRDKEQDFWKAVLIGIRMMQRQAYPTGHKGFGE